MPRIKIVPMPSPPPALEVKPAEDGPPVEEPVALPQPSPAVEEEPVPPMMVDEVSDAGVEEMEPLAPVEDAPVVLALTLAEIVAAAERSGNEYFVPAMKVDAAVERELERLGYGHERTGPTITVLYRK